MLCYVFNLCAVLSGTPTAVDGDTIRFPQGLVRIAGIDAEELHEPIALRDTVLQDEQGQG